MIRDYHSAIRAECDKYEGVKVEFFQTKRHSRAVLSVGDDSRFIVFPASPSDHRGPKKAAKDARKELRFLGAKEKC